MSPLVAIFILDMRNARSSHRDTMDQLRISQEQVKAAQDNAVPANAAAESVVNAERSWVMAMLNWWERCGGKIIRGVIQDRFWKSSAVLPFCNPFCQLSLEYLIYRAHAKGRCCTVRRYATFRQVCSGLAGRIQAVDHGGTRDSASCL